MRISEGGKRSGSEEIAKVNTAVRWPAAWCLLLLATYAYFVIFLGSIFTLFGRLDKVIRYRALAV